MINYRSLPPNFTRYVFSIQYFGPSFCGWQENQNNGVNNIKPSIYSILWAALTKFTGSNLNVANLKISSRTDAGVHAIRNTCQGIEYFELLFSQSNIFVIIVHE